jgi:hypothetical protein
MPRFRKEAGRFTVRQVWRVVRKHHQFSCGTEIVTWRCKSSAGSDDVFRLVKIGSGANSPLLLELLFVQFPYDIFKKAYKIKMFYMNNVVENNTCFYTSAIKTNR